MLPTSPKLSASLAAAAALLLAPPALAGEAGLGAQDAGRDTTRGGLLVELQAPSLDASHVAGRLAVRPSADSPLAFGAYVRAGTWTRGPGADARFAAADGANVRLRYGVGVEGRYRLALLGDGALQPFAGLTVGVEEFQERARGSTLVPTTRANAFFEPALGALWQPGRGRLGLTLRAGPGFTLTDTRARPVDGAPDVELRAVYPTASLGVAYAL